MGMLRQFVSTVAVLCALAFTSLAAAAPAQYKMNLGGFNLADEVFAFGATCSSTTETATTTAFNPVITVGAIGDFAVGQAVQIDHAGATATAVTPSAPTVQARSANQGDGANFAGVNGYASCLTDGGNASCTTDYTYEANCIDSGGGISAASSTTTITNGAATESISHDNDLQISPDSACIGYAICGCSGASCSPKLESILSNVTMGIGSNGFNEGGTQAIEWLDSGADHYFGRDDTTNGLGTVGTGVCPTSAVRQHLLATITAISGTSVTLSTAPSQSGTFTIRHDDGPAFNAAIATLPTGGTSQGGTIQAPICGNGNSYQIETAINLLNTSAVRLTGSGGPAYLAASAASLVWRGPAGGSVFVLNGTYGDEIDHFAIPAAAGTTPGIGFDIDKYGSATNATANDYLHDNEVGNTEIGISISGRGTNNSQNIVLENNNVDNGGDFSHLGFIGVLNGGPEALGNSFEKGSIVGHTFGVLNKGGSIWIKGGVLMQDNIAGWHPYGAGLTVFDGNEIESAVDGSASVLDGDGCGSCARIRFIANHIYPSVGWDDFADYHGDLYIGNEIQELMSDPDSSTNLYIGWANSARPVSIGNNIEVASAGAINPFLHVKAAGAITIADGNVSPTNVLPQQTVACNSVGTVTTSTTLSFSNNVCQSITTATTGLTYTLSTTGLAAGQVVEIDSYITGSITGPLWATSSGAIKWAGGSAPTSSGTSGYIDILTLRFDGTNWIEKSRSIGAH